MYERGNMFWKLFLLFTFIPIAELYVLIKIGGMIGALNTILIILLTASAGAYLAKSQGFLVFYQITQAVNEGRPPAKELLHGLFILLGGLLLLTPGFLTDFLGLSMLLPPIREVYAQLTAKWLYRKISKGDWRIPHWDE